MTFGYVAPPFGSLGGDVRRLLDTAVMRGGNEWAEVEALLNDNRAQLWLTVEDGAPVAAMVTRKDGDTLEVWLAGGKVLSGSIAHLETTIEAAKRGGMTNGRITGRKGWARVLQPYGWRPDGDDLVKDFVAEST